jgi:hypothetical protein
MEEKKKGLKNSCEKLVGKSLEIKSGKAKSITRKID